MLDVTFRYIIINLVSIYRLIMLLIMCYLILLAINMPIKYSIICRSILVGAIYWFYLLLYVD